MKKKIREREWKYIRRRGQREERDWGETGDGFCLEESGDQFCGSAREWTPNGQELQTTWRLRACAVEGTVCSLLPFYFRVFFFFFFRIFILLKTRQVLKKSKNKVKLTRNFLFYLNNLNGKFLFISKKNGFIEIIIRLWITMTLPIECY